MRGLVLAGGSALALGLLLGAAVFDCSGPSQPESDASSDAADAGGDRPPRPDAGSCLAPAPDDEPPADFWLTSGWQRLGAPLACCAFAVATDPPSQVPPIKWIPCKNGILDCLEDEVTWTGYGFLRAVVSRDGTGQPRLLKFMREQTEKQDYAYYEDDVYAFASRMPVAGWRLAVRRDGDACVFVLSVGGSSLGVLARTKLADPHDFIAWGSPPLMAPAFDPITGKLESLLTAKNPAIDQHHRMSPTSLAFDLVLGGSGLVRMPVGGAAYVMSKGNFPLSNISIGEVEGDDVYAEAFYGTGGWSQEYVMAPDGAVSLFRGKDKTHVTGLRSDGKTLFWIESYGLPDPHIAPGDFVPQPTMEVWSAPYTSDPGVLAATAKRLAVVPSHVRWYDAVAFGGLYAFISDYRTMSVVRAADGALAQIPAGPERGFDEAVYVSESEVWAVLRAWDDDAGTTGRGGVALARYQLRDW